MGEYADDYVDSWIGYESWGRRRSPKKYAKRPICKHCGATDVFWHKLASGSWLLMNLEGGKHDCQTPKVTADSFDDISGDGDG